MKIQKSKKYYIGTTLLIITILLSFTFYYEKEKFSYNSVVETIQEKGYTTEAELSYLEEIIKEIDSNDKSNININFIKGYFFEIKEDHEQALNYYFNCIDEIKNEPYENLNSYIKLHSQRYIINNFVEKNDYMEAVFYTSQMIRFMNMQDYVQYSEELIELIEKTGSIAKNGLEYKISLVETILKNELPTTSKVKFLNYGTKLYIGSSDYPKAIVATLESIKLSEQIASKSDFVIGLENLGQIYKQIGENSIATLIYEKALDVEIEDEEFSKARNTECYLNLAKIEISRKNYKKAEEYFDKVIDNINYSYSQSYNTLALVNIGRFQINLINKPLEAKEHLELAEELIENHQKNIMPETEILYQIAVGDYKYNENKYEDAIERYKVALDKSRKIQSIYLQEQSLLSIIKGAKAFSDDHSTKIYREELLQLLFDQKDKLNESYVGLTFENQKNQQILDENKNLEERITSILVVSSLIILIVFEALRYHKKRGNLDGLTKTLNRASLNRTYKTLLIKRKDFAVLILDLDDFKRLNDTFGHEFGDKVLIEVTQTIKDVIGENKIYRYGGEEFVVIIETRDQMKASLIAEKVRLQVELMEFENKEKISLSAGLAFSIDHGEETLNVADKYLYESKRNGKNKVTGLRLK